MREFLIDLGKTIWYVTGWFSTTNGQPPQDFQFYTVGLVIFIFACVCFASLIAICLTLLIQHIVKRTIKKRRPIKVSFFYRSYLSF